MTTTWVVVMAEGTVPVSEHAGEMFEMLTLPMIPVLDDPTSLCEESSTKALPFPAKTWLVRGSGDATAKPEMLRATATTRTMAIVLFACKAP